MSCGKTSLLVNCHFIFCWDLHCNSNKCKTGNESQCHCKQADTMISYWHWCAKRFNKIACQEIPNFSAFIKSNWRWKLEEITIFSTNILKKILKTANQWLVSALVCMCVKDEELTGLCEVKYQSFQSKCIHSSPETICVHFVPLVTSFEWKYTQSKGVNKVFRQL